jgi:hypothetical protein
VQLGPQYENGRRAVDKVRELHQNFVLEPGFFLWGVIKWLENSELCSICD